MTTALFESKTATRDFRVGEALSKAFSVFFDNLVLVLVIFGVGLAPMFPVYLQLARNPGDVWGPALIELAYSRFVANVCVAMVIYAAFQQLRSRRARIGESVSKAFRALPAVLVTGVIVTVLWVVGTLLLVVPGVIVLTMYAVALPVCVAERLGPIASLSRSAQLTKGFRFSIFGAFMSIGIGNLVMSAVIGAIGGAAPMVQASLTYGWVVLLSGFTSVFAATMYHDLRVATDGVDIDQIAAVFD